MTADEEIEQEERMASWTAIKELVDDEASEKRKFIFSPGDVQGPGQLIIYLPLSCS